MEEGWNFTVILLVLLLAITVFPEIVRWRPRTMGDGESAWHGPATP